MGFSVKSFTKPVTKAVKSVTKAVTKTAKSFVTAGTDAIKSAAKGDLNGVADAAVRASSGGTISLQGKGGIINSSILKTPEEQTLDYSNTATEEQPEGLLAYVDSQRNRRAKRNRQSTNNTDGTYNNTGNKLSGTTALGV